MRRPKAPVFPLAVARGGAHALVPVAHEPWLIAYMTLCSAFQSSRRGSGGASRLGSRPPASPGSSAAGPRRIRDTDCTSAPACWASAVLAAVDSISPWRVLGGLVHLVHGGVDLVQAGGLLWALARFRHQGVDLGDRRRRCRCRASPVSPTSRTPCPTCSVVLRLDLVSPAASAERWASARTSEATTAKPRPASRHGRPRPRRSGPAGWSGRRSRR